MPNATFSPISESAASATTVVALNCRRLGSDNPLPNRNNYPIRITDPPLPIVTSYSSLQTGPIHLDPNMDALQESGWEELRREARKIEGDIDVKLSSYAKLGSRFTQGGNMDVGSPTLGTSRSWKSMEMEIQSLLEKLLDINDSMSRCAASAAPTTSVTQKLARHRDILHEYTQEFRRTKGNINSMREHAELLSSVRDDISEYKSSGSVSPRMQLLRERAAIHGSISHIDDVINQAQSTRAALGSQRALFGDVQGKVKQLGDKFPVIRGLIGSIRKKRSRDTLILSAVIAACTLFIIIYWLSK